jgi:L-histidine N-alpha-methyltransferase
MPASDRVQARPGRYLAELRADVRAGLTAPDKTLPPKYFYDERGSMLFDEITRLPEYYLTRAETAILTERAAEIARLSACESLVELGSGTSAKTGLLLQAMRDAGTLREFVPFDVDPSVLADATAALSARYPGLRIAPFTGDFEHDLGAIPPGRKRMIVFIGSTIGNLDPPARAKLLDQISAALQPGDTFLLGTDLVKDTGRLLRAYDDAAGVTAEFNRNVLLVLNRELQARFDPARFAHVALWNEEDGRIEMRLRSLDDQVVVIGDLGLEVPFAAGEDLLTEISTKFTRSGVEAELFEAGFVVEAMWEAPEGEFLLTLATPYC